MIYEYITFSQFQKITTNIAVENNVFYHIVVDQQPTLKCFISLKGVVTYVLETSDTEEINIIKQNEKYYCIFNDQE